MIAKYEKRTLTDTSNVSAMRYLDLHNLPHWHVEHEIVCISHGSALLTVNDTAYRLTQGGCAFIKSESMHYIIADEGCECRIIKINASHVKDIVTDKSLLSPVLSGEYGIGDAFDRISAELYGNREYGEAVAGCISVMLSAEIFRREPCIAPRQTAKTHRKYKQLLEELAQNFAFWTIDDACKYMGLCKQYFSKYFHHMSGMTFTEYMNILKINAAIELLREDRSNMTAISIACGFGTVRSFNRVFKSLTGYSPKQLPQGYTFVYNTKTSQEIGFDPTINPTKLLPPV